MLFCSICKADIEEDNPSVLTMGRSATARYVCKRCESLLDEATTSHDVDAVRAAMGRIGELLSASDCEDNAVIGTVNSLMKHAAERADAIETGTYDFSLDESPEEEFELTEEMLETEEDRELGRIEAEQEKKLDKFLNWAWLFIGVGIVAYLVWLIFFR